MFHYIFSLYKTTDKVSNVIIRMHLFKQKVLTDCFWFSLSHFRECCIVKGVFVYVVNQFKRVLPQGQLTQTKMPLIGSLQN